MLHDLVHHGCPLEEGGAIIERCAGYWVPDGTLSKMVAQLIFPFVYDLLGAVQTPLMKARAMGYPTRRLAEGQGRGKHWHLTARALQLARDLLATLRSLGHEPEERDGAYELAEGVPVPLVHRGRRCWLHCPEHQDSDPSALLNPSGTVWCFGCSRVVGLATLCEQGAMYRRVISRRPVPVAAPVQAPGSEGLKAQEAQAERPEIPVASPALVEDHSGLHRGFFSALPISPSTRPYSLSAVLEAGRPGLPPQRPHGLRPTGLQVLAEGEECTIPPQPLGHVLGRRFGDQPARRKSQKYGMVRTYSNPMDLLDSLRASQRQLAGPGAMTRALAAAAEAEGRSGDLRSFLPDLYVSLDHHAHRNVRAITARNAKVDALILQPVDFTPTCTSWVGVDIDEVEGWPDEQHLLGAAEQIQQVLERHPAFSGRAGMIRTSFRGVQVVAELAVTRWDPAAFYADPHVRQMLLGLDRICLQTLHEAGLVGGYADRSMHAAGRMMRRPGPRFDKAGRPTVARLVWATP